MRGTRLLHWLLPLIPVIAALVVWLSPLAFVPVPWPDDSAFYFVAHEFFKWPPRWVMLPQAPFEPTYRIFNFNTMPLYPLMIGLGRFVGIDGSFAIKFWPLAGWALSGSLVALVFVKNRLLPLWTLAILALALSLDPILRWASVLVRPESLIGLFGVALVLGLTFGFPKRLERETWWWDPVSALLALAAYAHFNAIHLLFPVVAFFALQPKRLFAIASKTALYLLPWLVTVIWHFPLFIHQMTTQWQRLAIPNHWLSSATQAVHSLIPALGSPAPWPSILTWAAAFLWVLILAALLSLPWALFRNFRHPGGIDLSAASAWVLGSVWLWHTKPEIWFIYYIHLSVLVFAAVLLAKLWNESSWRMGFPVVVTLVALTVGSFGWANIAQVKQLSAGTSWRWSTYHEFVDCIDERLMTLRASRAPDRPFRVWGPTFPDVLVELSRRHPDWEFTRTNDFGARADLAVRHGREVDAVVVTEMLRWEERTISGPAEDFPQVVSVWMTWRDYFLNRLWLEPGWKQNRYICQRGRWQAFLFSE